MGALQELHQHGQSWWQDDLTRGMLRNGELARRVEDGLRGVTSNPAIFHAAITGGDAYDEQIRTLAAQGRSVARIYETLVTDDVREACDVLRPVYDDSGRRDGFVSLEVSPYLVHDTQGSIAEARRLWERVDRPNLMIKIPGSPAGVPAIETLLYEGVNVNVTLLFSIAAYETVAEAYLRALERRAEDGRDLDGIASVASFFLSRIDVLVDSILSHHLEPRAEAEADAPSPRRLLGRAAVANAKLAYRSFERLFAGERWTRLAERGAAVQRVLWASTSTKNPLYDEVRYVEPLVGPHTVNTMPASTASAFRAHGRIREGAVRAGRDGAEQVMRDLSRAGVDFDAVTGQLLVEGTTKFLEPYDALMTVLAERRAAAGGGTAGEQTESPGPLGKRLHSTLDALHEERFGRRLWARDPWLWTDDPERARAIVDRLGWLQDPETLASDAAAARELAAGVRADGIEDVVLLGMGGSSLCPRVAAEVFGAAEGHPRLHVLDDTDPEAVRGLAAAVNLERTLFVVASKSGTTVETRSLYAHFRARLDEVLPEGSGRRFVALTDPGTPLATLAGEQGFLAHVVTPEDVGGRYSALTPFGLLPMALLGVDLDAVLAAEEEIREAADPEVPARASPALRLGALLGVAGAAGRNKVTLLASPRVAPLAAWIEQLLAESTGKDGRGLLPVVGEPLAEPEAYGEDRVFVRIALAGDPGTERDPALDRLAEAGHPVVRIDLPRPEALGGEFLRWETATAVAGRILGVDPFDEPNVTESKRKTRELLERFADGGRLPDPEAPVAVEEGVEAYAGGRLDLPAGSSLEDALETLAEGVEPGGYLAVLAYLPPEPACDVRLAELRAALRRRVGPAPVTLGRGPRYLHSTGQLHKGGPASGSFLILTADAAEDAAIPDQPWDFAALQRAQALGDFRALAERGRRTLRVNLGWYAEEGLVRLVEAAGAGAATG